MKRVVALLLGLLAIAGAAAFSSSPAKYQPSPEEVLAALAHRSGLTEDALRGPFSNCDASQSAMNICAYRDAVAAELVLQHAVANKAEQCQPARIGSKPGLLISMQS